MRPAGPERGATPGREPSCNCCSKTPDAADGTLEVPSHYPLDTRAEFRALYPAQAVLWYCWLCGKGRAENRPVPRGLSAHLPQYRQRSHCHLRNKAQSVILTPGDSKHVPSQQWSGSEMDKAALVTACQDRMHWKRTCSSVCSRPVCGIRSRSWTDSVWDALIDWMLDCSNFCQCGYFIIHMLHTYPSN